MLDSSVPITVDARAEDGFVTLTGTAQWHYQREEAESRTADVTGLAGIDNTITLTQVTEARDARDAIEAALRRYATLEADDLSVETFSGGLVVISGTVRRSGVDDVLLRAAECGFAVPYVTVGRSGRRRVRAPGPPAIPAHILSRLEMRPLGATALIGPAS